MKNAILRHVHFDNCRFENNYFEQCQIDDVTLTKATVVNPNQTTLRFLQQSQLNHVRLIVGNHTIEIDENDKKVKIFRLLATLNPL